VGVVPVVSTKDELLISSYLGPGTDVYDGKGFGVGTSQADQHSAHSTCDLLR
jgi:hypothetical protein